MSYLKTGIAPLVCLVALGLTACASILPQGENYTLAPWSSYGEAQQAFDRIVPGVTKRADLANLKLDPLTNPNIAILNYSDVIRRFIPSYSFNTSDLDPGVIDCIVAKTSCQGYEVDYQVVQRKRYGNFVADILNFDRKVDIAGWRFNGVLLIKNDVVIYKLTGGEPAIRQFQGNFNPLGPFQGGAGDLGSRSR